MVFLAAGLALALEALVPFVLTGRTSTSDSSFPEIQSLTVLVTPSTCSLFADNSEGSDEGGDGIMEAGKLTCCVRVHNKMKKSVLKVLKEDDGGAVRGRCLTFSAVCMRTFTPFEPRSSTCL